LMKIYKMTINTIYFHIKICDVGFIRILKAAFYFVPPGRSIVLRK